MIPAIMIGVAAILFMLSVISLQIASFKQQGTLVAGGLMLLFVINLLVAALLIIAALGAGIVRY